jgi:hypothetical protein
LNFNTAVNFNKRDLVQVKETCHFHVIKLGGYSWLRALLLFYYAESLNDAIKLLRSYTPKNITESVLTKWRPKCMYSHHLCMVSVKCSRVLTKWRPKLMYSHQLCVVSVKFSRVLTKWRPKFMYSHQLCVVSVKCSRVLTKWRPKLMYSHQLCVVSVKFSRVLTTWRPKFMYTHQLCVVSVKFSREGNSIAMVIIKVRKHDI